MSATIFLIASSSARVISTSAGRWTFLVGEPLSAGRATITRSATQIRGRI
jgi:hypothetical protein